MVEKKTHPDAEEARGTAIKSSPRLQFPETWVGSPLHLIVKCAIWEITSQGVVTRTDEPVCVKTHLFTLLQSSAQRAPPQSPS